MATSTDNFLLTVLFDGNCPLCRREIAHYQRRKGASRIQWIDISSPKSLPFLQSYGLTHSQVMAVFHTIDRSGQVFRGAAAFLELWSQLPAYRWLSKVIHFSGTLPILEKAYLAFARRRYAKSCRDGRCST